MIEHKIGETFTFTDHRAHTHIVITEENYSGDSCESCYFDEDNINCEAFRHNIGQCHAALRQDGNTIIFKEVRQ